MRIAFRFRPIPFVATVLLVALGVALGNWQQGRAQYKAALQARIGERGADAPLQLGPAPAELAPLEFRRVSVAGRFVDAWPVFLDNRPMRGQVGYYLVMPFKIAGSEMHVLVARGWLPRQAEYGKLPRIDTPQGTVTIEGIVTANPGRLMQLGTPAPLAPNAIVQNVEVAGFAEASGLALQPFFVQQTGPAMADEVLVRDWPAPSAGIDKHRGYALQWYGLAAMAFLFFVITGIRSGTKHVD